MKKITYYFKKAVSIFLKIIIAILMGLGSSLGNKPMENEHKNNKTVESNK
jgi:hypothetical protein